MGRASLTEAVLTVYLASLECSPIDENQLIDLVKEKLGCDETIVRRAIDVLIDSKRTWVRQGTLLRPKTLKEFDYGISLGSFKTDPKRRPVVLNYIYFGLAVIIGVCATLQYLTPVFLFLPVILLSSGVLVTLAVGERFWFR